MDVESRLLNTTHASVVVFMGKFRTAEVSWCPELIVMSEVVVVRKVSSPARATLTTATSE